MTTEKNASALLAGGLDTYLDLGFGEDGIVDRPTGALAWAIATDVTLEKGALIFPYPAERKKNTVYPKRGKAHPDARLLTRFIELAGASDEQDSRVCAQVWSPRGLRTWRRGTFGE